MRLHVKFPEYLVTKICFLMALGLTVLGWSTQYYAFLRDLPSFMDTVHPRGIFRLLALFGEANIPTWFSSVITFVSAVLLLLIAGLKKEANDPFTKQWFILSLIFVLLSLDETAQIHEAIGSITTRYINLTGYLAYSWVLAGSLFVLLVGSTYLRFTMRLEPKTRLLVLVSALLYVGASLGMEMLEAKVFSRSGTRNLTSLNLTTLEEFLEMSGIIAFNHALMRYLNLHTPD